MGGKSLVIPSSADYVHKFTTKTIKLTCIYDGDPDLILTNNEPLRETGREISLEME